MQTQHSQQFSLCYSCLLLDKALHGIVLECDDGVSHTLPFHYCVKFPNAVHLWDLAGLDFTDYLMKMLNEHGYHFTTTAEREIHGSTSQEKDVLSPQFQEEMDTGVKSSSWEEVYGRPDGQVITIGNKRFKCPKAFFRLFLLGTECEGIHNKEYRSVMESSE